MIAKIVGGLTILAFIFSGFLYLDTRHASSAIEARVVKNENAVKIWGLKEDTRKLAKRIAEIENDFRGSSIPPEWQRQIEWLKKQIDDLNKKIEKLEG